MRPQICHLALYRHKLESEVEFVVRNNIKYHQSCKPFLIDLKFKVIWKKGYFNVWLNKEPDINTTQAITESLQASYGPQFLYILIDRKREFQWD